MSIDWSKAPDWTIAHALYAFGGEISEVWVGEQQYQRLDHPRAFPYGGGVGDARHNPCRSQFRYETLRPSPWTSEGLPPVGTVCERNIARSAWCKTTILAVTPEGKNVAYQDMAGQLGWSGCASSFRPIRTPEQIAAEERLAAINYMEIDAGMCATAFDGDPEARVWIENLVDKGWRKPVAP